VTACARETYKSAATGMLDLREKQVLSVLTKKIKCQMAHICSSNFSSVLKKEHKELSQFNWDELWAEFSKQVPLLLSFLQSILPKADKIFITFVVCMLLKKRSKHMSLMQRLVSVLLYGNAANKQVCGACYTLTIVICIIL